MNINLLVNCLLISLIDLPFSLPSPSHSKVYPSNSLPLSSYSKEISPSVGPVSSPSSSSVSTVPLGPYITGLHVENDRAQVDSLGINIIYADTKTSIRLFGSNFTNKTLIALTRIPSATSTNCNDLSRFDPIPITYLTPTMAMVKVKWPKTSDTLYICAKNVLTDSHKRSTHQMSTRRNVGKMDKLTNSNDDERIRSTNRIKENNRTINVNNQLIKSSSTVKATIISHSEAIIKSSTIIFPGDWVHQGNETFLSIQVTGRLLPLGLQITLIVLLLCLTGLFAGLNLGLMSLDKNELRVIALKGDEAEKRYARTIEPLRKRGNFLLCTILLSNVAINSTLTVLLDQLTTGLLAIIIATISIVIIGDIIPQAICSRHGLAVGAKTIWITYLFMVITAPLSWPISKILDIVLGDEIGQVYDRERLMEFIRITRDYSQLETAEVNIISGALELKKKTVGQIMTALEDVFMLPLATRLDFDAVSRIEKSGFSRIPIYKDDRRNIVGLLYVKDLAFVDPDDNMPLTTVIEYYRHPLIYTWEDTTLDIALGAFKEGKSHLSFVRRLCDDTEHTDPYYEVVGLVTLEDVIEEILQTEIVDETDVFTDNRLKQRRPRPSERDSSVFSSLRHCQDNTAISPQMVLATYQFLSSSCSPFANQFITETILRRLLSQPIYFHHVVDQDSDNQEPYFQIYTRDKPADYFVMILEGRVQVTAGKEQLTFYGGPFTSFGVDTLKVLPPSTINTTSTSNTASTINPTITTTTTTTSPTTTISVTTSSITTPTTPTTTTTTTGTTLPPTISGLPTIVSPELTLESNFIYKPDYTVEIVQTTTYLKITRKLYLSALKASQMDRGSSNVSSKAFSFPPLAGSGSHSLGPIDSSADLSSYTNQLQLTSSSSSSSQQQQQPDQKVDLQQSTNNNLKFNTSTEQTSSHSFINPSFEMDS